MDRNNRSLAATLLILIGIAVVALGIFASPFLWEWVAYTNKTVEFDRAPGKEAKALVDSQSVFVRTVTTAKNRFNGETVGWWVDESGIRRDLSGKEVDGVLSQFRFSRGDDGASGVPPPRIEGTIVSVRSDADLVILSVGQHDGVQLGDEFAIHRGEDRSIAEVRVIKVTEDLAGALILHTAGSGVEIQPGDQATTKSH